MSDGKYTIELFKVGDEEAGLSGDNVAFPFGSVRAFSL
jgi:hypothetical protein